MRGALARAGFWGAAGVILHTVAGLPAALAVRSAVRPRPDVSAPPPALTVTVVLAAHDEAHVIADKVRNTFALDHPPGALDMVLVCDGCGDDTASLARAAAPADGRLTVIEVPRGGKNAALRAALPDAHGQAVLFTDADAMLAPDALRLLLAPLGAPDVGGTAGRVRFAEDGAASGERAYWSAEDRLRRLQSRAGSLTSAAGPIYLVRSDLIDPPPDGVTDDFWISVQVPLAGRRLVFVPEALAVLPPPPDLGGEFRRKVRIICAGLRGVWLLRRRFRGRFIDVQVVTHKALRRLLIVPAAVMWLCSLPLARCGALYRVVAVGGGLGALASGLSWVLRGTRAGRFLPVAVAAHIVTTLAASVAALVELVRGSRHDTWSGGA